MAVTGAFEELGAQHVGMLNEARRVLFAGLMSGAPEQDCTELLLGLRAVDYVHILDRPEATGFPEVPKPDVHLSADWVGTASIERT